MKKFDVEIKRNSGSGEPLPAGGYVQNYERRSQRIFVGRSACYFL